MRGGERLVKECSWMRGICSRLYHSTEKYKTFSCRCPSSVMANNRFRSADYLPCQLFNFGMIATGNHNFERFAALCNTLGGSQETHRRWLFINYWAEQSTTFGVQQRIGRVREPTYRHHASCVIIRRHCRPGRVREVPYPYHLCSVTKKRIENENTV